MVDCQEHLTVSSCKDLSPGKTQGQDSGLIDWTCCLGTLPDARFRVGDFPVLSLGCVSLRDRTNYPEASVSLAVAMLARTAASVAWRLC